MVCTAIRIILDVKNKHQFNNRINFRDVYFKIMTKMKHREASGPSECGTCDDLLSLWIKSGQHSDEAGSTNLIAGRVSVLTMPSGQPMAWVMVEWFSHSAFDGTAGSILGTAGTCGAVKQLPKMGMGDGTALSIPSVLQAQTVPTSDRTVGVMEDFQVFDPVLTTPVASEPCPRDLWVNV
ncbi:hypothetical protein [Mesorhizobium sp. M0859]|uniref:hypothetical protein n=1 Tax=Mesorhizobium sp. M0859 TaxID=2957014 RepID=UPI00333B924B